jgi:hypothetical protein
MKKRGFLILTLAMTVAGVASANVFTPLTADPASRLSSLRMPPPAAAKPPVESRTAAVVPAPVAPAPVTKKPSIDIRQAPVPLLMKARPPVDLPAAKTASDGASPAKTATDGAAVAALPAKPGDESGEKLPDKAGESLAKAAIEADGYKGVRVLRQGVNGIWHARALRGKTEVGLTVDGQGNVTADQTTD